MNNRAPRFQKTDEAIISVADLERYAPFTQDQIDALLQAAKRSQSPARNQAIIWFLLDTGMRASDLCSLLRQEVDFQAKRCSVLGKGNRRRVVPFGKTAAKALWNYLKSEPSDPNDPLFVSERGEHLTRSGLRLLFVRLGRAAKIEAARCSPHTFRHTFAVEFLRAGGNVFTLQQILGHTSLTMTNRYVALAQADIENQHRQFSPADRQKGRSPGRKESRPAPGYLCGVLLSSFLGKNRSIGHW